MTLQEKCKALAELKKKMNREGVERAKVTYSEPFLALTKQIDELMKKQDEMLAGLYDSSAEYEALRCEVMEMMKKEKVYAIGNVAAKWKEKSEVNKSKVLQVIDGDLDLFVTLANITQVSLKDFAKATPELKKPLLDCIEVVSKELVDLVIDPSLAA